MQNTHSLLTNALRSGNDAAFSTLLQHCVILNVNAVAPGNCTLLVAAVMGGSRRWAEALLRNGALPDLPALCPDGSPAWTPLAFAACTGQYAMVRLLLDYGANINQPAYLGRTPLVCAVLVNDARMVRRLLRHGADPDIPMPLSGWTARRFAQESCAPGSKVRRLLNVQ